MSTEAKKAPNPILLFLNEKKDKLVAAVPRTFQAALTWESIVQGVAIALEDTKTGPALSRCKPSTVYSSLLTILRLGLDPAPIRGQAYLIPRGDECTALIGAQGKIELAYRSGMITKIVCQCVYASDDIEIDLANGDVVHRVTKQQLIDDPDPGPAIAAYARVWIRGTEQPFTELMRRRDFEKIKRASKSPAYRDWEDEMYRRSVLNRALKRAPKSAELMEVLNRDVELNESPAPVSLEVDVIENEAAPRALPDYGTAEEVDAELERMKEPIAVVVQAAPPKPEPKPTPAPAPVAKPSPAPAESFAKALPTLEQLRAEIAELEKRVSNDDMVAARKQADLQPYKPLDSRLDPEKLSILRDALRVRAMAAS